ncbi:MAG: DUF2147 domain-containing protein [Syntrophobacteraceae bacterium]|nr:DUF2147 domain-containing protein [Syntrophobacteraceae bacterium]
MKAWIIASALFAVILWTSLAHGAGGDAILGTWNTQDHDTRFEIYKCGMEYCGKISYLREPNYSPANKDGLAGLPRLDSHNPDPRLRKRTLLGLPLLEGFRYRGDNLWEGGKIYDPEDGRRYSCKIWTEGKNQMKLRGYMGFSLFGRTETWIR